jgi:putative nucleotidyltransferase with HDIG domain
VHARLRKALQRQEALTVGVAHNQLVIEGAATDPNHPLISDLAGRLHDHQLGAISFDQGVTLPQVEALLQRLSHDVEQGFEPIGLVESDELPSWAHVRLFPVGYDQLRIREGNGGGDSEDDARSADQATDLWLQLAQTALETDEVGVRDADPLRLAKEIRGHGSDVDEQVVGHLLKLTEVLQHRPRGEADAIRAQVSQLIQALDPDTLERLLEMGGDFDRRRKFLLDASQSLAVDSVVKILQTAATASDQTISTLLIRLLKKLAWHAEEDTGAARDEAEAALKENVEDLIEDWSLEDPNPNRYTLVLDSMAGAAPALAGESRGRETSGAVRVAEMALELDAWGATVHAAVIELFGQREVAGLLDVLDATGPGNGRAFMEETLGALASGSVDTAEARQTRPTNIRYGAVGVDAGTGDADGVAGERAASAGLAFTLREEADTVEWLHAELRSRGDLHLLEAEAIVRSLSVAMHGEQAFMIPLLRLKKSDEYTTTHALNVSILATALAEYLGLGPKEVRSFGISGLLHDLGKTRVPDDILNKPGKLTPEERTVMNSHTTEGARILLETERQLDLAAVVAYEHHIKLNGEGYPELKHKRACHPASDLVHVCDVYDALRTHRPYRVAWEATRVIEYIREGAGSEFNPHLANSFVAMMREWETRIAELHDRDEELDLAERAPQSGQPPPAASPSPALRPSPEKAPQGEGP